MSIVSDVQTLVNDSGVFWGASHVYNAINEAQLEMWGDSQWAVTTATLTLGTNSDIVSMPATIMIPHKIVYGGIEYHPTSYMRLEQWSRTWRSAGAAQPKWFVVWDATHFRVWPKSDGVYELPVIGAGWPTEITSTNTDITAHTTYKDAVAYRAAQILLEATRPDMADAMEELAEEARHTYKKNLRNQLQSRVMRVRPGTMFNMAQGGSIRMGRRLDIP